ncbi:hypothetical protein SLEP1_g7128 [Rubroshorea leprosula]|uniref:Uncharacterized protein n=1 Tax=Rubroshorea leprosula TaxID=152421 RepID=A0AAV5I762_9ROSI|nr:hypothetical protein SLEP1_g7128 [Rubroshorea leprosula]
MLEHCFKGEHRSTFGWSSIDDWKDGVWKRDKAFEGVAMPAMNNILSKWLPVAGGSRSLALVYSGMYLGSVTGLAFSPLLRNKFGWPSVFFSSGSLGTVWFAVWLNKVTIIQPC